MSITIKCAKCDYIVYASQAAVGKSVRCPGCAVYYGARRFFRSRWPSDLGVSSVRQSFENSPATGRQDGAVQQVPGITLDFG